MTDIECEVCGLTPFDLPDDVDPELFFERDGTSAYCPVHVPDGWWDVRGTNPDEPTFADEWGTA